MKKKQVFVNVLSEYNVENEIDTSEFFAEGSLYLKNGKHYLIFDTVYDELNSVKTTLIVHSPNKVTLINSGSTKYSIILEENIPYESFISYDELAVDVEIHPKKVECNISENGYGKTHLNYIIKGNGTTISENTIDMKITPKMK